MLLLDRIAEARIQEAIERGDLDELPGAGRPLVLDDDAMVPEELRMAYRILKNAGCLPPELELRREAARLADAVGCPGNDAGRRRALKRLSCLMTRLEASRDRPLNLLVEEEYYQRILERLGT